MPSEPTLSHRVIRNSNLAYVSNLSPTATDPCYIPGSLNVLTSINGYAQRRLGFAEFVESTPTTFTSLSRIFTWDRTDGTFIEMACDVVGSQVLVYKRKVGTDPSFVLIYTDTVSMTPFDFVVSNNTVYFSNGHVAKKWDPVNGVSNWGIAIGSVNNAAGPNITGAGTDVAYPEGGTAWTNPNNVTSTTNYATVSLAGSSHPIHYAYSDYLEAQTFGFGLPSTETVNGIQVTVEGMSSSGVGALSAYLLKAGSIIGALEVATFSATNQTMTFGGVSDLWGTSWTANDINQATFGVAFFIASTLPLSTFSLRNVNIKVFGIGGPTIAVAAGAGTFTATIGYQYVYAYGNSNTGHLSSPSPASASTGAFANKLNVAVTLTASTDPQVNQIRVFRSTDSVAAGVIAGTFFELPTSPYPNTPGNILDNSPDSGLIVSSIAPTPTFNDPPPPGICPVYFSGRIWMIAGNKVWFSGLEEILQGVPEESWPSGIAGNFWAFDEAPNLLAVAGSQDSQTLGIWAGGRLSAIVGNSLDTFRRYTVSSRRGCRNRVAASTLGGLVAWLDTANQIWSTDGTSLNEIGLPIRPDLVNLNQTACSMTFHVKNNQHWLVFSTGTQLFVYDMDTEQWMPPWSFACQYLWSGEVSVGTYKLMASTGNLALQMSDTAANDNGVTYPYVTRTSQTSMVPDFGTRFSSQGLGMYDQPSRTGQPWFFQIDTNANSLADVLILADDDPLDPASPPYKSIFQDQTSVESAFNRNNGTKLRQNVFALRQPMSRWISWQFEGMNADDNLKVYGWFVVYKESMGK